MEVNNRDKFVDILKGIGIISIVLGHSCTIITKHEIPVGSFVYTYHLMIFMFIIGYLFDYKKFDEDKNYKYQYIGKQIIKMLVLYFLYNLLFVLLHNIFVNLNIINASLYSDRDFIKYIFNGFSFQSNEVLLGAMWFIPMMLFAKIFFVILYSKKIFKKHVINLLIYMILTGLIGLSLCINNGFLEYHIQISILSVSFICLGGIYKIYEKNIVKFIKTWMYVPSALLIFFILKLCHSNIDLSNNQIINPLLFYTLSILGIYFCLSLAKLINSFNISKRLVSIIGENSFHIMALHFLVIKLIDISYARIHNISDIDIINKFPYAFSFQMWKWYFILGIIIPVIVFVPLKNFKRFISKKL